MSETTNRFLSIEEVLANVVIDTDNEDSRDSLVMRQWVWRAIRQIGYVKSNIKECIHEVCNLSLSMPKDLAEPIYVNLLDHAGNPMYFHWHTTGTFEGEQDCLIVLSEQNDRYQLSSNAGHVKRAEIRYWAFPTDEKGDILTPEIFLEAVLAFVDYMWWKRERTRKPKQVSRGDVEGALQQWQLMRIAAKGDAKMPNAMEWADMGQQNTSALNYLGPRPQFLNRRTIISR